MNDREVLVIGTRNVGKTCYAAQVYRRLQEQSGSLKLLRAPAQLTLLEKAMESISEGASPVHTPAKTHDHIAMQLTSGYGDLFTLTWPDYGGEQINRMLEERTVPPAWVKRTQNAGTWLLFLRLSTLEYPSTVLDRVVARKPTIPSEDQPDAEHWNARDPSRWDPNAYYVELLQMLLHARNQALEPLGLPKLGVVLSCWDELQLQKEPPPEEVLKKRLPLLHAFTQVHWQKDQVAFFGLAATGVELAQPGQAPASFLQNWFPEDAGFVVAADGKKHSDLTLPISWGVG